MSYVTLPDNAGTEGFMDIFKGMLGGKKAKKKAKAKASKKDLDELKKLEDEEKKDAAAADGDPSKRGDGIGGKALAIAAESSIIPSVPNWAIYAGAGVAVLGIILWSKKK